VCAELHGRAFNSMAIRSNLIDSDITELTLESDSDAHSLEDEDISPQSVSDRGNTTDTLHSGLTTQTVN